jgi:hypothetical protein
VPPPLPVSSVYVPAKHHHHHREVPASNRLGPTGGRNMPPPPPPPPAPRSSGYVPANHQHHHRDGRATGRQNGVSATNDGRLVPTPPPAPPSSGREHCRAGAGSAMRTSAGRTMPVQETRSASFDSSSSTGQVRNASLPIPDRPGSNHRVPAAPVAPRHVNQHGLRAAGVAVAPAAPVVVPERPASNPSVRAVAPPVRQAGVQQAAVRAVVAAPRRKILGPKARTAAAQRSLTQQDAFFRRLAAAAAAANAARGAAAAAFPRGTLTPFRVPAVPGKRYGRAARLEAAKKSLAMHEAFLLAQVRACVRRY